MGLDNENNNTVDNESSVAQEPAAKKGKGRRGGNSAHSIVVHSGNFKGKGSEAAAGGRRPGESGRNRAERDGRSHERGANGHGHTEHGYGDRGRERRDYDRHPASGAAGRPSSGRGRYREDGSASRPAAPEAVLGIMYNVKIEKTTEVGAFVKAPEEILNSAYRRKVSETGRVLLPFAEQLGRPGDGAYVSVYFYEDKGGRLACTMRSPILKNGELGILKVAASTSIGVFLENNAPKQVLLPFSEQIAKPEVGDEVLVWLYTDKSGRPAATMRVYGHLDRNSPYKEDDRVTGFVYEVNEKLGVFVAVDCKYYGMIPIGETFKKYRYGDTIEARVARVREDGKLDLLVRGKLYETVEEDADVILYELKRNRGFLPYGDRADADFIEETYAMSKNQFKRALGHLYKNHIVELDREKDTVTLISEP